MLSREEYLERLKNNQPISYTGAIRHSLLWLTASSSDIIHANPLFQPQHPGDPGIVIYCIHGTADRNTAFSLVSKRLLPKLPTHISAIHMVSFHHRMLGIGIDDFANQLKDKIAHNQHQQVILMGHSRGGLVAAYYAEYLAAAARVNVNAVFTIGTPFAGSDLAMAPLTWLSTSVAQMQPNSQFLADLRAKLATTRIPYHYFAAENDAIVNHQSCCIAAHQEKLRTYDRHGHLSVMSSHRLMDHIAFQLQQHAVSQSVQTETRQEDIDGRPLNLASP